MSERDDYPAGAPCWVDALRADPKATAAFWAELCGWELEERPGPGSGQLYYGRRPPGRAVAGVGSAPAAELTPHWKTYVRVDDVDATTVAAIRAGGRLVDDGLTSIDDERRVLLADPAGAVFGINQRLGA